MLSYISHSSHRSLMTEEPAPSKPVNKEDKKIQN